jgi:hypothetical protein
MLVLLLLAGVAGICCGIAQLRVWAILLAVFVYPLIVVAVHSSLRLGFERAFLAALGGMALAQISYLCTTLVLAALRRRHILARLPSNREALHIVQTAIADELRVYFEPPDELPRQLRAQLTILESMN